MKILVSTSELREWCEKFPRDEPLALDMEFERERSYRPILQLVQLASRSDAVLVDPLAIEDMTPLWDLIKDESIETILHAAGQDMEIFYNESSSIPGCIFDTQIAAALVGMGEQIGYADLVRRLADVKLKKGEQTTRWDQRPLTESQMRYALDDVNYLHKAYDKLKEKLRNLKRESWIEEELSHYHQIENYVKDPTKLWMRVSRHRSLSARGLGLLQELAAWRENTAMLRNIPRGRVLTDDLLIEICKRNPDTLDDLRSLRRLHPREAEKSGEEILESLAAGRNIAQEDLPKLPSIRDEDPDRNIGADLLVSFIKFRGREKKIAASYLGTKKEITALVNDRSRQVEGSKSRLMRGWRFELVGREILQLLSGELKLGINPKTGHLTVYKQ